MPKKKPDRRLPLTDNVRRFGSHWAIRNHSPHTFKEYERYLSQLLAKFPSPAQADVEAWLAAETSISVRRMKARSLRAFGKWLTNTNDNRLSWWSQIPLPKEPEKEQPTVTLAEYLEIRERTLDPIVRLLVELLWSTGVRRTELAQLLVKDVNLEERTILVRKSKTDEPRYVPITEEAAVEISHHLQNHMDQRLVGRSSEAIRKLLKRREIPSAHPWRRGWAVDSLMSGLNEVSVRTAAGWRSGAMVARYTKKHKQQIAMSDFRKLRGNATGNDAA
jgi:integrase